MAQRVVGVLSALAVFGYAPTTALAASPKDPRWSTYESPDGTFRVQFPTPLPPLVRSFMETDTRRTHYSHFDANGTLLVEVFENPRRYTIARAAEILRNFPNPASGGIDGQVVRDSPIRMGQHVGRALQIEGTRPGSSERVTVAYRAFVTDGRLYLVTSASKPGGPLPPQTERFFESFVLLK